MKIKLLVVLSSLIALMGCSPPEDYFLDPGIPRVETPADQIAYVRTKWMNDKHIETAFLDSHDRVLEVFRFGRSSSKTRHLFKGGKNTMTITYQNGDSSPPGYVSVDTLRRTYGAAGRMTAESRTTGYFYDNEASGITGYYRRFLDYTTEGDTIIKKVESSYDTTNTSTVVNIYRYEKDDQQRLRRHYRLYVMRMPSDPNDTTNHFSQRFAYDSTGKLALAWFDYMYLGRFYMPTGPDTIQYEYDSKNRLIAERHRYTTDMRNKSERDTTGRNDFEKESIDWYRKKFFVGDKYSPNNNRTDIVTYRYEAFDPEKHLPLKVPDIQDIW